MHHKPGKTNIKADILSRRVDHNRGEDDNKDVTVLKDEWFRRIETVQRKEIEEEWTRSMEVEMKMGEEAIIQRIKKLTRNKRRIDQAVEKALRNEEREWERE